MSRFRLEEWPLKPDFRKKLKPSTTLSMELALGPPKDNNVLYCFCVLLKQFVCIFFIIFNRNIEILFVYQCYRQYVEEYPGSVV